MGPRQDRVQSVSRSTARPSAVEARTPFGHTTWGLPLTTRIRADYALALTKASLERQLKGETPHTILDILEEALEPWLRAHGDIP